MKILNFEANGLNEIDIILQGISNTDKGISEKTMRELLKTINISFIMVGLNRLQSTLICEIGESYVQQSQRYVDNNSSGYVIPKGMPDDIEYTMNYLINKSLVLYNKMTELKPDIKSGRPTIDNFKYGIPFEDARYILPLAVTTNVTMSMSGDHLINFLNKLYEYRILFNIVIGQFQSFIPHIILSKIIGYLYSTTSDKGLINSYYNQRFKKIKNEEDVIELEFDDVNKKVAIGALTSTSSISPIEAYNNYGDDTIKSEQMVDRVLGYGHSGIAEQSRNTFGMMCSLSAYHQFIRHRIQVIHREDLKNIIIDNQRNYYIPESIITSKFYSEYMKLVDEYNTFLRANIRKYSDENICQLLLNCHKVKFIVSNNARADGWMYRERLCLTAQTEIREMMEKKYLLSRPHSEIVFRNCLPTCVYGTCKEGNMTCGKAVEMKKKYYKE